MDPPLPKLEAQRVAPDLLRVTYRIGGDLARVAFPRPQTAVRTDGLWRHSCCEAFLAAGEGYYEFNFSPSAQWAAYRFDGYRQGGTPAELGAPPALEVVRGDGRYEVAATVDLGPAADRLGSGSWRIGLSAVIEEAGGRLSYWALAHPAGRPDFHHRDCFALELPAPDEA